MKLQWHDLFRAYPHHIEITPAYEHSAQVLAERVNALLARFEETNAPLVASPVTGTLVSLPNGGWRHSLVGGARGSAHRYGAAVDLHDPDARLDSWITAQPDVLDEFDLYMEDPRATQGQVTKGGWCHLSTRAPRSGNRVFMP